MYKLIMEQMKAAGYEQYEISNFARQGYASRHNMTYWRNEDYYGLGAGAHGYVGRQRYLNIKSVTSYNNACKQGLPRLDSFWIEEAEAMEDFMMVGLRMLEGVSSERFAEQFDGALLNKIFAQPIQRLLKKGLLEPTEAGYRLTDQGLLFGNDVFAGFVGALKHRSKQ
jgi:oxygen-independent coproporphyrinogen-3 oxidase